MKPTRGLVLRLGMGLAVAGATALLASSPRAQTTIVTDWSWDRTSATLTSSTSAATVIGNRGSYPISGTIYTISRAQGKLAGINLFHSFERFSIGSGDAAVFTTTSALSNVISRESGISATTINGLLAPNAAAGSQPNFFFVNPNGVTFGAGAQVDWSGALPDVQGSLSIRNGGRISTNGSAAGRLQVLTESACPARIP